MGCVLYQVGRLLCRRPEGDGRMRWKGLVLFLLFCGVVGCLFGLRLGGYLGCSGDMCLCVIWMFLGVVRHFCWCLQYGERLVVCL